MEVQKPDDDMQNMAALANGLMGAGCLLTLAGCAIVVLIIVFA